MTADVIMAPAAHHFTGACVQPRTNLDDEFGMLTGRLAAQTAGSGVAGYDISPTNILS